MKIAGFVLLLFSFVNAAAQTQSTPKPQPTPNPREEMQRRVEAQAFFHGRGSGLDRREEPPGIAALCEAGKYLSV